MSVNLPVPRQKFEPCGSMPTNLPTVVRRLLYALIVVAFFLPNGAKADPIETRAEVSDPEAWESANGKVSRRALLPFVQGAKPPPATGSSYVAIPVLPPPTDRPAVKHGDLNLALRGYSAISEPLELVPYGGSTDSGAPQMPGIFSDYRTPRFTSVHRVYDWNWGCSADGCRGIPLTSPPVTLLGMATTRGEMISAPTRGAEIYGGGYTVLVLYAEHGRITLKYTREDNVVTGYTVHLEKLDVDPDLLALYQETDYAGRGRLPALKNGQALGRASGNEILVAVRDCGTFLDPRSRKDWWQGR